MSITFTVVRSHGTAGASAEAQATIRMLGERFNLKPTRLSASGRRWLLAGQFKDYGAFLTALDKEDIHIVEDISAS